MIKKMIAGLLALPVLASVSMAESATYFELPSDFVGNATLTITTAFLAILGVLGLIWVIGKFKRATGVK